MKCENCKEWMTVVGRNDDTVTFYCENCGAQTDVVIPKKE